MWQPWMFHLHKYLTVCYESFKEEAHSVVLQDNMCKRYTLFFYGPTTLLSIPCLSLPFSLSLFSFLSLSFSLSSVSVWQVAQWPWNAAHYAALLLIVHIPRRIWTRCKRYDDMPSKATFASWSLTPSSIARVEFERRSFSIMDQLK